MQNLGMWTAMELLLIGWLSCRDSPSTLIYFPISFWGRFAAAEISCEGANFLSGISRLKKHSQSSGGER